jgi:hypothetical protein
LSVAHTGTYKLSGGTLSIREQEYISGTFIQTGGEHLVKPGEEGLNVYGNASFLLMGGILTADHIRNDGTFNYSGGSLNLTSDPDYPSWTTPGFTNNGNFYLTGAGTRKVDGDVINNGTVKTTHTTAVYTGTFTNNGAYVSDPATQYFNDLIVGNTGYLVGQYRDKFYISGDFINHSTMSTDWNTMHSYLSFIRGADILHGFYLTGIDYGALMSGYSDNFSWGTLNVTGNILSLYDGNDIAGGALYLREILGLDISGNMITNISGMDGLNVYYMPNLKDNEYLGGLVYDLSSGGYLIPIYSTPEPSTMLLLGSGLIGLVGYGRKKFFKK